MKNKRMFLLEKIDQDNCQAKTGTALSGSLNLMDPV